MILGKINHWKNRNMSLNQLMHITASINQILLTDEMTPGEKKAKHKPNGGNDHCRIKRELKFLNTKHYLKNSDTHEKDNRGGERNILRE